MAQCFKMLWAKRVDFVPETHSETFSALLTAGMLQAVV